MKPRQILLSDDSLEETLDSLSIELESSVRRCDDLPLDNREPPTAKDYEILTETVARVGGEVSRIRAEVDALLDQNAVLLEAFERLKEVIEEKNNLNIEDFDLACEVVESRNPINTLKPVKKIHH